MKRAGIIVTSRPLRYQWETTFNQDGEEQTISVPHEKGIDVRLALDIVKAARTKQFDVAVIYSQDQDLCEVVDEVKEIAKQQGRPIVVASAFPSGPKATYGRGIDRSEWIRIEQDMYDACVDPKDYRPPFEGLFKA